MQGHKDTRTQGHKKNQRGEKESLLRHVSCVMRRVSCVMCLVSCAACSGPHNPVAAIDINRFAGNPASERAQ